MEYYLQSLIPVDRMYFTALVSFFCYFPACIISVYVFLHSLLPLIQRRKYLRFILGIVLLGLALVILNYFTTILFYQLTCECSTSSLKFLQILGQDDINTAHAMTTGGLVLGFKVAKEWIVKQKENQRLIKLKIANELRLQKARIYPGFLLQTLNNLYTRMTSRSGDSPELILKLSDLLSYLLYESTEEWIPLEKELGMVANLLSIEKINRAHNLTIHSQITSDSTSKFIKPLIIFPLLQNCFEKLGSREKENYLLNLEITESYQILHVSLLVEQKSDKPNQVEWSQMLKSVGAKLNTLYQDSLKLKIENHNNQSKINLDLLLVNDLTGYGTS